MIAYYKKSDDTLVALMRMRDAYHDGLEELYPVAIGEFDPGELENYRYEKGADGSPRLKGKAEQDAYDEERKRIRGEKIKADLEAAGYAIRKDLR